MASSKTIVTVLLLSLALCQISAARPIVKADLADTIVGAIKEVTTLSGNLRDVTLKINVFNAPVEGPKIAAGFATIITKVSQAIAALSSGSNPSPLGDDDAKLVVGALTTFVQVHQQLLNVVIGKHGVITLVPFFEPIRVALVQLEAVVDTFAYTLIGLIPTQKPAAEKQFGSLSITIGSAIRTYETPLVRGALSEV